MKEKAGNICQQKTSKNETEKETWETEDNETKTETNDLLETHLSTVDKRNADRRMDEEERQRRSSLRLMGKKKWRRDGEEGLEEVKREIWKLGKSDVIGKGGLLYKRTGMRD